MCKDGYMCFKVACLYLVYFEWDPRIGKHVLRSLTKNVFRVKNVLLNICICFEHEIKLVSCLRVVLKTVLVAAFDDLYMYKLMFKENASFTKVALWKIKI